VKKSRDLPLLARAARALLDAAEGSLELEPGRLLIHLHHSRTDLAREPESLAEVAVIVHITAKRSRLQAVVAALATVALAAGAETSAAPTARSSSRERIGVSAPATSALPRGTSASIRQTSSAPA
jgi:hypothetical protein